MSTPNAIRLDTIESNIIRLENHYDGDCDLFDDKIQMNYIDYDLLDVIRKQNAVIVDLEARLSRLEVFTGMVAPAPLPIDDSAPAVTFAEPDNRFEVAGWDEPTADEVTRFWGDENADERADVIREARYGKQL